MTQAQTEKAVGFLGLCARAGQLTTGQESCVAAIRGGGVALALVDESSSENTLKRFRDSCESHGVPLRLVPSGVIGQAIGKPSRMAATIAHGPMAKKLLSLFPHDTDHSEEAPDTVSDR